MRLISKKLNKYSLTELLSGIPKVKGHVFSLMQSPDRNGNPSEYWEATYFSDMTGNIKVRNQSKDPRKAIVLTIKQIRHA